MVLRHTSISPTHILYANPQKNPADLQQAYRYGVRKTTVDSVYEIEKIANIAPVMECYVRIYANDPDAQCPLSHKYGAFSNEWEALLECARKSRTRITGVSFHVGSGAKSTKAFEDALNQAVRFTRLAETYGFHIDTLDLGGGFTKNNFTSIAAVLREHLCDLPYSRVIAEPGRFFAESAATLFTKVIGRRDRGNHRDYYLTDSIYGSFNAMLYDHLVPKPSVFHPKTNLTNPSTLYGATCDGLDTLVTKIDLPDLQMGDWLYWENMGAYTTAGASLFNGFPFPFLPKFYL